YKQNIGPSLSFVFLPTLTYVAILFYILRKNIIVPINELQQVINKTTLYKGMDMGVANRKDEIGELAKNIKKMADDLVKTIPVGIFITTPDLTFEYANAYFLQQFKYDTIEEFQITLKNNPCS
ncbi:HAMP domain-containing protein, partial [Clostridium perfringens]|uniref:HAMP domain-containing protein n=1 Tax=Clostridium perfringens TaxID=1502 RepID=UPI002AC7A770